MNDIIDFAIVTALQVEREAVLEQMDAYEVVQAENDPQTYFRGHVTLPAANERYEVVVIMLMGMGNNEAAIATTRLIERWHPASVIMLGIGAGVPGEVNLGDVIVADFIYYYELAKRTVEGEQRRGQQFPCDRLLFERARAHRSDAWYRSIDLPRPDGQTLDVAPPRVCFGPIASGEKVVADETTLNELKRECPKLAALAMEGAGVARAAFTAYERPRFLEIRGVSDYASPDKNDHWHDFAVQAAAAFLVDLLRTRPTRPLMAQVQAATDKSPHPIRTPDQRLRVFVSSTLQELIDERKAARQAIEQLRLTPVMFELGARPHPPKDLYRAYLDQSDIFIGVYWQKYGWVAPEMDISGLEDEWRLSSDKPKLIYIKSPAPDREARLKGLLDQIRTDDRVSYKAFSTPEELRDLIGNDLALLLTERFETAPTVTTDQPPVKARPRHNLPNQLTSFIGREKETAEIMALFSSARLVTLTGSGGTGKTRLAQEVGARLLADFSHGVWFVGLAPLSDPVQIIPVLAQVFGLQELPFTPLAKIVEDYLRDKRLLLLLDNCEHLIEACARLADDLLHQCAGLKILASSREALGIAGEVAYRIPSLADSESTQLFVDRAHAVNSKFNLTDANRSAVTQICHRLDGIPLAIELAAARTKLLSAEQIATRLNDMFHLLVGGSRTALPRQQTLRALIDWSYDLLSDEEKRLLQFASVFVGGWRLDALEFVADEPNTLDLLEQLVNKSLVVTEERDGEMRYFLLETIRQYAREKLFDAKRAAAARDRHFSHYKDRSSGSWDVSYLAGAFETQKLKSMQVEVENLRAAFEWALQNHVQDALELAANVAMSMSTMGSQIEGITILRSAMEKFRALPPVEGDANRDRKEIYAHGCFSLGTLLQGSDEIMFSRSILQEAIAIARELGDKHLLGLCLEMYANGSAMIRADDTLTATLEGLETFREINDSAGMGMAYSSLARWATIHGNFQEAEKYVALAQALRKDGTISIGSGFLNLGMGIGARTQGRFDLAMRHFEEGLRVFKQIGHKGMVAGMTSEIAHTQRALGNYTEAKKTYQHTIKVYQDYGNRPAVAHQLECFAMIAILEEEPQRAAKLFGAAEAIREATGHKPTDEEQVEEAKFMSRLRSMLSEAEFSALWAEGRALTMEQAIAFALADVESADDHAGRLT